MHKTSIVKSGQVTSNLNRLDPEQVVFVTKQKQLILSYQCNKIKTKLKNNLFILINIYNIIVLFTII